MKIFKRVVSWLVLVGLLSTIFMMPATAKEDNMFQNGDFSNRMQGWQTWQMDPAKGSATIEKDGGPDGSACLKITNKEATANSIFQYINCQQGKTYMMTADIKYEGVSSDGSGFCLGISTYDSAGNNIGEWASASNLGTSEWRTVSFVFEITNSPARVNGGPRLWFSSGTVYVDNVSLVEVKKPAAESKTYELELSSTANRHTVNSLGCEWDPKMLLESNTKRGITEEDLDFIKGRMEALGLQAVRMMITPDWFEKQNDNDDPNVANAAGFDFDNDEMRSVFAYLKVCQELGVRVTLTWWGAPTGHWLACENTGDWIGAPNDLDEMAENIAYLLSYIRNELKYDCVKELILQNEPSYSFKVDGGAVDFDYYVEYYKTVRDRLKADGMEDIVLVGADDSQHYGWYYQSYEGLKDICGKFNSHNYAWSYDMPYLDVLVQEFVSARTGISGDTPFYLGEFGDGSTQGAYVAASADTYGRGIYVASVVVNAFKAGAAGASYWPLHDIYYYEGDPNGGDNGGLMSMGLISFKTDGAWGFRPTYYAYGLLCNYIPFGSEVYNVTGDTEHLVDTVAIKTPEGRWSIIAVNRSEAAQTLNIKADAVGTMMKQYIYADGQLPTDGSMIGAEAQSIRPQEDAGYCVSVPAQSFIVLSNIGMTEADMEIPPVETSELPSDTATEPTTGSVAAPDTSVNTDAGVTTPGTDATSSTAAIGGAEEPTGGCASVLGGGAVAILSAAAVVAARKKREE